MNTSGVEIYCGLWLCPAVCRPSIFATNAIILHNFWFLTKHCLNDFIKSALHTWLGADSGFFEVFDLVVDGKTFW